MIVLNATTITHQATNAFSKLVEHYLEGAEALKPFYAYAPNLQGIAQAIKARQQFPIDRATLVAVLLEQYKEEELSDDFLRQIHSLSSEHTFTVCTAHQPDLMTGYLYFFYKIIHTARLAQYLKEHFPEHHFVPVFYIGSEDNDLEELSVFHYDNRTWRWHTLQTGAVGRMETKDLLPLMQELQKALAPPGVNRDRLLQVITEAYDGTKNIALAIRHIVHTFLSPFGVVVLDADDTRLKQKFVPVMKEELLRPQALTIVSKTSTALSEGYKAQAYARPINLFYLRDNLRERIEKADNGWRVVNSSIAWPDETALLSELSTHPERFSPNVILRGPYQESILPDVAFIGGGSEVAYWMQLKELFAHYNIFFPALVLRQSALWMPPAACKLQEKLQLSDEELFLPLEELKKQFTRSHAGDALDLSDEVAALHAALDRIKAKAEAVDVTLSPASKAVKAKASHLVNNLEKKMVRARKRQLSDHMRQIEQLKSLLFPDHTLQERHDCFLGLYLTYGERFLQYQYEQTLPWGDRFLLIKDR